MEDMIRAHTFIEGRVQGVFFREWTKNEARKLNLNGYVKNLNDGRVEAIFEGSKDNIKKILSKCRKGPKLSKPTNVEFTLEKASYEFEDFKIVY